MDKNHVAYYYSVPEIVMERGERIYLYDIEGNRYYDMLGGFASLSQGHCHPKIADAMYEQAKKLTMTSRSLMNTMMPDTHRFVCEFMGYEQFLAASSGVEACESAVKLARKWGYTVKGIAEDDADIIMANGCFWGRSISASGNCSDPMRGKYFGPHTPGFPLVPYNDVDALEYQLQNNPNVAAIMLEPIQGEAGTIVPDDGYLKRVYDLSRKYNCLLISDEVQAGLGRTGNLLATDHDLQEHGLKPDIVTLGKALSGGMTPASGIVADRELMSVFTEGNHGSTFGGNPLTMAIVRASLEVIRDEGLIENAAERGEQLRAGIRGINSALLRDVRGRGLMNAIEVDRNSHVTGVDLCNIFQKYGMLTKATKDYSIRFTPPLVITAQEVEEVVQIMERSLEDLEKLNEQRANESMFEDLDDITQGVTLSQPGK